VDAPAPGSQGSQNRRGGADGRADGRDAKRDKRIRSHDSNRAGIAAWKGSHHRVTASAAATHGGSRGPGPSCDVHTEDHDGLAALSVGVMLWSLVSGTVKEAIDLPQEGRVAMATAQALQGLGLQSGDRVALVGPAFDAYGPHLGRLHVAAQIVDAAAFQGATVSKRKVVFERLRRHGIHAIVAPGVPSPGAPWVAVALPDGRPLSLLKIR